MKNEVLGVHLREVSFPSELEGRISTSPGSKNLKGCLGPWALLRLIAIV